MKKIAVVILNYCNYQETMNCVESIRIQKGVFVEIIIVDNGSPNDSYERLAKEYRNVSDIYVLRVHKNYGFAKGNNIGIKYACNLGAEFIYLLNSDIVLQKETCIADLLKEYKPGVGVIGARLIERNGKERKFVYDYPFAPEKWWYFACLLFESIGIPLLADYWLFIMICDVSRFICSKLSLQFLPGLLQLHIFLFKLFDVVCISQWLIP